MVRLMSWHCPPDTEFEPWRSGAEHATSRSRRLPTILNLYEWAQKKHFSFFENWRSEWFEPAISKQAALTTAPGPPPVQALDCPEWNLVFCQITRIRFANGHENRLIINWIISKHLGFILDNAPPVNRRCFILRLQIFGIKLKKYEYFLPT